MFNITEKDRQILVCVASKEAAELLSGEDVDNIIDNHDALTRQIYHRHIQFLRELSEKAEAENQFTGNDKKADC